MRARNPVLRLSHQKLRAGLWRAALAAAVLVAGVGEAGAATTTATLGNAAPPFVDGDTPPTVDLAAAQAGQPAPFDQGKGNEILGPDFTAAWTFVYGAPADPIQSASLTLGLADHDSAASGGQVALFAVELVDLTSVLSLALEARGGTDAEYNVYSVDLPSSVFGQLADGTGLVQLQLQGPGLVTPLFPLPGPNPPTESSFNGAHLVFATLAFETVPEPCAAFFLASTLLAVAALRAGR